MEEARGRSEARAGASSTWTWTRLLKRERGEGSPVFGWDGQWVPLVDVESQRGDRGAIRVGDRHLFLTDPDGGLSPYQWWSPRICIRVERAPDNRT